MKRVLSWTALALVLLSVTGYFVWRHPVPDPRLTWPFSDEERWAEGLRSVWQEAQKERKPGPAWARLATLYIANAREDAARPLVEALAEHGDPHWQHRKADLAARRGDLDEAIRLWEALRANGVRHAPLNVRYADSLRKLNRRAEAEAIYQKVIVEVPSDAYAWYGLISLAVEKQDWKLAQTLIEDSRSKGVDFYGIEALRISVAEALGDQQSEEAARSAVKRLGKFRELPDPWLDAAKDDVFSTYQLRIGAEVRFQSRQWEDVRAWLERALSLNREEAATWKQLGRLHGFLGRIDEAATAYREAIRIEPTVPETYWDLANLLRDAGRRDEAVALVQACVTANPTHVRSLTLLASYALHQGNRTEARHYLQALARLRDGRESALGLAQRYRQRFGETLELEEVPPERTR